MYRNRRLKDDVYDTLENEGGGKLVNKYNKLVDMLDEIGIEYDVNDYGDDVNISVGLTKEAGSIAFLGSGYSLYEDATDASKEFRTLGQLKSYLTKNKVGDSYDGALDVAEEYGCADKFNALLGMLDDIDADYDINDYNDDVNITINLDIIPGGITITFLGDDDSYGLSIDDDDIYKDFSSLGALKSYLLDEIF
jgi:predicted transcriptional regulator